MNTQEDKTINTLQDIKYLLSNMLYRGDFKHPIKKCWEQALSEAIKTLKSESKKAPREMSVGEIDEILKGELDGHCISSKHRWQIATALHKELYGKGKDFCQVRWKERGINVVCGEPLPCPKHSTQPQDTEKENSKRIIVDMESFTKTIEEQKHRIEELERVLELALEVLHNTAKTQHEDKVAIILEQALKGKE